MSEEFEVKGPHEEALESGEGGDFGGRLAVMTAIMATAGALLSYEAGVTMAEAILAKNEASIQKTQASDQWNFYQAKSNKQNLVELAAKLTKGADHDAYISKLEHYEKDKAEIKKTAEEFDRKSVEADKEADRFMVTHHKWATGTTAMQIGISLAAIALLTRRRWLQYASLACAAAGLAFAILAMLSG